MAFAAFDVLALDGRPLIYATYQERRRLLADLCLLGPAWCTLPTWRGIEMPDLLAACELHGVDGVVAKRLRSRYRPGRRSPDWVKIKTVSWRVAHAPRRMERR